MLAASAGIALGARAALMPLDAPLPVVGGSTGALRLVTWNVVNGTRLSLPPALVPRSFVAARLGRVAQIVRALRPDVLALQEADGAALDPTTTIATAAELLPTAADGHGATLATRSAPTLVRSGRFVAGGRDPKGWTLARLSAGRGLDVVSVHLHAFAPSIRRAQIDELARALEQHRAAWGARPMVVAGDMNDGLDGTTRALAEALGLEATPSAPTFHVLGVPRTLDWVLVSPELEVVAQRVLDGGTSDHRPVVADVDWRRA